MFLKDFKARFRSWAHYAEAVKLFGPSFAWYAARQRRGLEDYPFLPDSDFGRFCDKGDQTCVFPASTEEVSEILRHSHHRGVPVNVCGRHHSMNGQTLVRPGGKRLVMDFPFNYQRGADQVGAWVEVPASADWFSLEVFGRERLRFPVFTTHLSTAIGGTLSVSGVGQHSVNYGRQIDQVLELEMVLPNGEIVRVSPENEPEIFRMTLAGFGLFGVVTRVRLRLIPTKEWVCVHSLTFETLEESWNYLEMLCREHGEGRRPDTLTMTRDNVYYSVHLGYEFHGEGEARSNARVPPGERDIPCLKRNADVLRVIEQRRQRRSVLDNLIVGKWGLSKVPNYHPYWNEWVFPTSAAAGRYTQAVERLLKDPMVFQYYFGLYFLVVRHDPQRPHSPLSLFGRDWPDVPNHLRLGVGTYFHVPMDDERGIFRLEQLTDELQALAHAEGGRLYLYTHHKHRKEDLALHYGEDWDDVVAIKRKLDPAFLLNGDVLPFD